ncbi:MAG: hypothetical protein OK457_07270 [Thaumarchaeota archaeon]|nr:hypothetical protein [Nitrososphaerota archaeon]
MPTYVVLSDHPPSNCPSSNKAAREFAMKTMGGMDKVMEKYKIKQNVALHLDPGHKVLLVLEAPSVEAVRDMIYELGYSEWNDTVVYPTTPVAELLGKVSQFTPIDW